MTDLATMTTPASATDKEAPVEPSQEDSSQEASEETNGGRADRPQPARESNIDAIVGLFRERHHADVRRVGHRAGAHPRPRRFAAGHLQRAARNAVGPPPAAARLPASHLRPGRRPSGRGAARRGRHAGARCPAGAVCRPLLAARGRRGELPRVRAHARADPRPRGGTRAHDGLPPHGPGCQRGAHPQAPLPVHEPVPGTRRRRSAPA